MEGEQISSVFESCLFKLLKQCRSCGQEVELNTSARGTLLVVNGTCPDGHVLTWQSQPLIRDVGAGNYYNYQLCHLNGALANIND